MAFGRQNKMGVGYVPIERENIGDLFRGFSEAVEFADKRKDDASKQALRKLQGDLTQSKLDYMPEERKLQRDQFETDKAYKNALTAQALREKPIKYKDAGIESPIVMSNGVPSRMVHDGKGGVSYIPVPESELKNSSSLEGGVAPALSKQLEEEAKVRDLQGEAVKQTIEKARPQPPSRLATSPLIGMGPLGTALSEVASKPIETTEEQDKALKIADSFVRANVLKSKADAQMFSALPESAKMNIYNRVLSNPKNLETLKEFGLEQNKPFSITPQTGVNAFLSKLIPFGSKGYSEDKPLTSTKEQLAKEAMLEYIYKLSQKNAKQTK